MLGENGWTGPVQSQEGSSKQEVMRPGLMVAELQLSLMNVQTLRSALGQAYLGPLCHKQLYQQVWGGVRVVSPEAACLCLPP